MIISYGIVFKTEKERFALGPLHSDHILDELDVACDLVSHCDSDVLEMQHSDIYEMMIVLAHEGQLEIHDLDPELIWTLIPAAKIIVKENAKGGDDN